METLFKLFFIVIFTVKGFSQIPNGYYNTATGTGYTLKTQLFNIIDNHNSQSYNDLWSLYTTSAFRDHWYENNNSLLDLYSEKPTGTDSYEYTSTNDQCGSYGAEGDCYNREHLFPQGFFNQASPMKSDAHFVVPSDGKVNGVRDNFPFGKVDNPTWTSTNGSKKGSNLNSGYSSGYTGTVFEPIDEFKGDVARAMFYVATRYQDVITSWDSWPMVNGTNTQVYANTFKNILLTWHQLDPVSPYEIGKNNEIYYNHQGNRNPFIDHPEWVNTIWGNPAGIDDINVITISIYPNPNKGIINFENNENKTDFLVIDVIGKIVKEGTINSNIIDIQELNNGIYFLRISNENVVKTAKFIIDK
jgi:endonuclease I